jgi:hypothetical protein
MPTIASRGAARLAAMVALVALVTSGCGGGTKTSDTQTNTTQANATQTNGLESSPQPRCSRLPPRRSRPPRVSM